MRNAFLVLVLGFDVVDIECRNEDSYQNVCSGIVHDFQNPQLAVVGDPSSSFSAPACANGLSLGHVWRKNFRVNHHSTSKQKTKLHRSHSKIGCQNGAKNSKTRLREQLRALVRIRTFVIANVFIVVVVWLVSDCFDCIALQFVHVLFVQWSVAIHNGIKPLGPAAVSAAPLSLLRCQYCPNSISFSECVLSSPASSKVTTPGCGS